MKLTETKKIRYDDGCKSNPVFLSWINSLGGWNYWLFEGNQTVGTTTSGEIIFEKSDVNLETDESFKEILSLQANNFLIIGASNIDINDIELIKTMLLSVRVQMLINPTTWQTEGAKWITVFPQRGTFSLFNTREKKSDITIQINLTEIKIQTQ